jgi:uncharacterized protein (TIGR02217 family)
MSFHEVRFPDDISRGARGGPSRRTQVVTLASGTEERNASWSVSRRRYDVAYGIRRADDLAAVVAFFEARNGRLHGFRFRDWGDYKSCMPSQVLGPSDQLVAVGDGTETEFQMIKHYTSGDQTWSRVIEKPVAGSISVALDSIAQPTGWTLDATTGLITFDVAPATGVAVTAGFQFDVPVRFDTDELDVRSRPPSISTTRALRLPFAKDPSPGSGASGLMANCWIRLASLCAGTRAPRCRTPIR